MSSVPEAGDKAARSAALLAIARVKPRTEFETTSLRLVGFSPVMVFMATLVVGIVLLSFAYVAAAAGYDPEPVPRGLLVAAPSFLLAIAFALGVRRHRRKLEGLFDLVIDEREGLITLPCNFGRKAPETLALADIVGASPAEELPKYDTALADHQLGEKTYSKRELQDGVEVALSSHRSEMMYAVVLVRLLESGEETLIPILRSSDLRRVNALALWLNDMLARGDQEG